MMKQKRLAAFLLAVLLLSSSGCSSGSSSGNSPESSQKPQQQTQTQIEQDTTDNSELSSYHVVDIGEFHNGLARITVYVYSKGYWSSVASAAGYSDGYFLYGYINEKGDLAIKPIYSSAPEVFNGLAAVEIYEDINKSTRDIIDTSGNSITGTIENWKEVADFGEVVNGILWVKTVKKTLSGNTPTITYYNKNGKMFSIENADIVPYYSNSSEESYSNFYGEKTILCIDGINRVIDKSGNVYTFKPVDFDFYSFEEFEVGVKEYDRFAQHILDEYSTDVSVYIYPIEDGEVSFFTSDSGRIDWKNQTITHVEYYDMISYGENFKKSLYKGIIQDMLGVDVTVNLYTEVFDTSENVQYTSLSMRNNDGETFYCIYRSTLDSNGCAVSGGQFVLEPTQDIIPSKVVGGIVYKQYQMCSYQDGLCLAQDAASGLYGYLGTDGKWAIEPQYQKAGEFSEGLATVNGAAVIDTKGSIVFEMNKK